MPNHAEPTTNGSTSASRNPTGRRPRGPEHFASETAASEFPGLPEGESHAEIAELLETLGGRSGWSAGLVRHFTMLLGWTRPQDWHAGAQPIVWLSVRETARALGISTSQVRRNEKKLHEIGALSWKDSPNHRRYGARDATGAIVDAWGVNLAPAAALLPELRRLARDREDDRTRWKFLRHRVAACRANILAAVDTALANGSLDDPGARAWRNLVAQAVGRIAPHTPCNALERRLRELDHLDTALQDELAGIPDSDRAVPVDNSGISAEMHAREPGNARHGTHIRMPPLDYTTNISGDFNHYGSRAAGREGDAAAEPDPLDMLAGPVLDDVPIRDFLAILPPSVRLRLPHPRYGWPELIEAAWHAAGELGVSQHAWGEACGALGPERATVALAIVAAKHERGLIRKPGGYFRGMTRKHLAGELHLRNSIFGLRQKERGGRGGSDTAGPGRAR